MNHKSRKEKINISTFDVGASGHLEAAALMRHFQEIAARHATQLNVGFDALRHDNIFWALTHLQIEAQRWPGMGETIYLETWPCNIEKLYTTRDYLVTDENNETLIRGTSAWIMVDIIRKRPVRPAEKLSEIDFQPDRRVLSVFPEKIEIPNQDALLILDRKVVYSDLDINNHVNNTRYIEWIMDAINPDKQRSLSSINLHFSNEFQKDELAQIKVIPNQQGAYHILITHKETDKSGCSAFLRFK